MLAPGDQQYLGGYLAKDGEVVNASCGPSSVIVRPVGTPYPRGSDPNWPLVYQISICISEGETLNVTVEQTGVIISLEGSRRLIGRATGSVNGGFQPEAMANGRSCGKPLNNWWPVSGVSTNRLGVLTNIVALLVRPYDSDKHVALLQFKGSPILIYNHYTGPTAL